MPFNVRPSSPLSLLCLETLDPEQSQAKTLADFTSIFALPSKQNVPTGSLVTVVPDGALGQSRLRRLQFLADPNSLPLLLAPLVLQHVWNLPATGDVVFAYRGVSADRLTAAAGMLQAGCEAVVLRRNGLPPLLIAVARTLLNERLVAHWVDCVESFSLDTRDPPSFDPLVGGPMFESVCDRLGSLLYTGRAIAAKLDVDNGTPHVTSLIRRAIKKLMPDFPELREDPLGNSLRVLNAAAPSVRQDPGSLITALMLFVWSMRADLQEAFSLTSVEGRRGFVEWYLTRATVELGITDDLLAPVKLARKNGSTTKEQPRVDSVSPKPRRAISQTPSGVNLIGYPRAEMGMGEQLRTCAGALSTAGVDFCITDFTFGIVASHQDTRYEDRIGMGNPYPVNLFHINADQMSLAWDKLGPQFFRTHYNIAYWEWELSNFPDEWLKSIDMVDEIWAPSQFIQAAISKKTNKPVVLMPLAIEFPIPSFDRQGNGARSRLGLPHQPFLFLFPFDFSSFSTRKNFTACIEAFRRAFPEDGGNVGLLLKTIRHPHHQREFWDLLRTIGSDRRIHVIDRVLRQTEMRELISSCDSFVSLHRSEGFGLGIAEAMFLGKPVIVTNYSGNVDFTKSDNSCLVDYQLIPVNAGEYVFPEGQVWADPDIQMAAACMRRLVADRDHGKLIGDAAADFMRRQHSYKAIGARYAVRLQQIAAARSILLHTQA